MSKSNPKIFCDCPWCGLSDGYRTTKGMPCFRCNNPIDKDGNPIHKPLSEPAKDV